MEADASTLDMPSDCCYFVEKAAAAGAAPAFQYFDSIFHHFAVVTQNLGQTPKARDDSQEEPSRASLFSLAKSQNTICFFLYFYTDSLKYLALKLKEIYYMWSHTRKLVLD